MDYGLKIKMLRIKNKLKQVDLANALAVSSVIVSNWETGKFSPSMKNCQKLSRVFGIPLEDFCNGNFSIVLGGQNEK